MRFSTRKLSISFLTSVLFTLYSQSRAQDTRFFISPGNLIEGATGSDSIDSSINWEIGDTVDIRWEAEWDRVTLKIWQGVWDNSFWFNDLMRDEPNTLKYTWTVAPVLSQAQDLYLHFQLLNADNTDGYFNSKNFRIYNKTVVETPEPTTLERTVTREVTVTPSPSPTPEPEPKTTSEESSTEISTTLDTSTTSSSTTSSSSSTSTSESTPNSQTESNSNGGGGGGGMSETTKVGLGVGVGLGVPLIAAICAGVYFLGRRHRRREMTTEDSPTPPPPPPMKQPPTAYAWHDPNAQVGGIDSMENLPGGTHNPRYNYSYRQ